MRSLGTRVSCSHKFSFCGGFLKTTHRDKNHSGDELFLFQAFADGWFSRYITFMTTSWSNVTHLETASQACSTEGCDDALLWFFQLLSLFFFFSFTHMHRWSLNELLERGLLRETFRWLGSKKKNFLPPRMYLGFFYFNFILGSMSHQITIQNCD